MKIYHSLRKLKLPIFKDKFNEQFFDLFENMNITDGIIPNKKDYSIWYDIMEKDPLKEVYEIKDNTWGFEYKFTEDDLFKKINNYQSIDKFAEDMAKNTGEIYEWLNKLYTFLKENNSLDCLNNFNMIPNKNGNLKKINELFGNDKDNKNKIPEIINPIYQKVFNKDINEIVVNENINIDFLGRSLEKKNFENILNEFSDYFKGENQKNNKKEYLCNELLSFSVKRNKME